MSSNGCYKSAKGSKKAGSSDQSLLLSSGDKSRVTSRPKPRASTKARPLTARDLMEIVERRSKQPAQHQSSRWEITADDLMEILKNGENRRPPLFNNKMLAPDN